VGALFHYSTEEGDDEDDDASNWRTNAVGPNGVDPMRPNPAAMVGTASTGSLRSDVITMPDRHDHHRRNAHSGLRVKVTSPPPGPPEGPNSYSPA